MPALVYLTAVPMWPRLRKFGNPYAFAAVDGLYSIFWFSAWVAVATYVSGGKSKGSHGRDHEDDDEDEGRGKRSGCGAFAYGSSAKCELSTGTVILGVIVLYVSTIISFSLPIKTSSNTPSPSYSVIFAITTYMSVMNLLQYRRTGTMPYDGSDPTFAAHSQAAFSSNPAQDFDEEEDRDAEFRRGRPAANNHQHSTLGSRHDEDEYALLQHNEVDDMGPQGGRPAPSYDPTATGHNSAAAQAPIPLGNTLHDYDTSYSGAYGHRSEVSGDYGYNRP